MASSLPLLLLLCILGVAHSGLLVSNLQATGLRPDKNSHADGYVKAYCASAYLGQTNTYRDSPNPSWSTKFTYDRALPDDLLELIVYDDDVAFDDKLGICSVWIKKGSNPGSCKLETGGTLSFSYSLS